MVIKKFEDCFAWQVAFEMVKMVYVLFKNCRDYAFRDQIQRAAVSVMSNIAEGLERQSDKELRQFLFIAKGSCGEVRSLAHLAQSLEYIDDDQFNKLFALSIKCSQLTYGLIKTL